MNIRSILAATDFPASLTQTERRAARFAPQQDAELRLPRSWEVG